MSTLEIIAQELEHSVVEARDIFFGRQHAGDGQRLEVFSIAQKYFSRKNGEGAGRGLYERGNKIVAGRCFDDFADDSILAQRDAQRHPLGGGKDRIDLFDVPAAALHEMVVERAAGPRTARWQDDTDRQVRRLVGGFLPALVRVRGELALDRDLLGERFVEHARRDVEYRVPFLGYDYQGAEPDRDLDNVEHVIFDASIELGRGHAVGGRDDVRVLRADAVAKCLEPGPGAFQVHHRLRQHVVEHQMRDDRIGHRLHAGRTDDPQTLA